MNIAAFKNSLTGDDVPGSLTVHLQALWYDAKGQWEKAHELIQDLNDEKAAWIHAYLHRKEGDTGNAGYWYRRAGKARPSASLNEEWETLAQAFLQDTRAGT